MGGEKFVFAAAFPGTSRRQRKSFSVQQFFKNAAEVWASSPHLRSKSFCNLFSLLQLHFLKLSNSNKVE